MRRGERFEARKRGLKRYFTGKPCARGHVAERLVSNKVCLECLRLRNAGYRADDPEPSRRAVRKHRKKYPERRLQQEREQRIKHKAKRNAYSRAYNKRTRKRRNEYQRDWLRKNSYRYKLQSLLRQRIRVALKSGQKGGSAVRDLGCSIEEFRAYIAKMFTPEMSWENHGEVWHLHHVKPVASFDLTDPRQFRKACHFTNMIPLTIEDHKLHHRRRV